MSTDRLAAILGVIWLGFLAFPITSLFTGTYAGWQRALGLVLILAFAAVYASGYLKGGSDYPHWERWNAGAVWSIIVQIALAGGVAAIIGLDALGFTCFLIAGSMFSLPMAAAWAFASSVLALTIIAPLLAGAFSQWAFMTVINIAILGGMGASRFFAEQGAAQTELDRQRAVVTERERVARDVHDVLGHSLTVIALKTELAERLLDTDPARARAELREANTIARDAIADVRATVGGLKVRLLPEELEHARTALMGAGLSVTITGEPDAVDPRNRIVLAWAVREATTNILRHSGARVAALALGARTLVVDDDGVGLGDRADGHGLTGLRERIEDAGGTLALGAAPTLGGTRLEVTL